MSGADRTLDKSWTRRSRSGGDGPPLPGIVTLFSNDKPALDAQVAGTSPMTLGRGQDCDLILADTRLSRRHAEVRFDGVRWQVRDLDSRNGTFLDGVRAPADCEAGGILGVGDTLLLLTDDVRPYLERKIETREGGVVVGPRLRLAWNEIASLARSAEALHITGETGTGKELAARLFHDSGPRPQGPFVAVNCAAIPSALAERLLFGARRGAYSGADADSEGYLATADGGTLFLDELAELSLEVQGKLLRVIETGEVLALGASRGRKVAVRFCSATHGGLRQRVAEGKFREDLYYRLCQPTVSLPPLRERPEEIPWIIDNALGRLGRRPHASLVEAALLRPWPGNVRELIKSVEVAAHVSADERVKSQHLSPAAGMPITAATAVAAAEPTPNLPPSPESLKILQALRDQKGNVARAAQQLKMHRTQLRRWLTRNSVNPREFGAPDPDR